MNNVEYTFGLMFGKSDPQLAWDLFLKSYKIPENESALVSALILLAYAQIDDYPEFVYEFIQRNLKHPSKNVKITTCIMVLPRVMRNFKGLHALRECVEKMALLDENEEVRKAAAAALAMAGIAVKEFDFGIPFDSLSG